MSTATTDAKNAPQEPPAGESPLVELENVGKNYGNIRALREVDMTVDAGQVTCVLGDNGAGKSTLIKIIAGLHQHTSGVVRVRDRKSTRLNSSHVAISYAVCGL